MGIEREQSISALIRHADGEKTKHEHKLELLLSTGMSFAGACWFDACEDELLSISEYRSQIAILQALS